MNRIRMEYISQSPHFGEKREEVVIERDGSIQHAIDTFRTFLIAMGFEAETIDKEVLRGEYE